MEADEDRDVEVLAVGNELTGQHTFVRLETDSGISGLGQSACWGYQRAWPACSAS